MNDRERSIHLSPVQVLAGALASITAAVLASFFGVAGTVIGAGVVSAAASVGNALYSYWLRSTNHAIRESIPSVFRQQASTVRTPVGSGTRLSRGSPGGSETAGAGSDPDNTNEVPALDRSSDVPPPGRLGPPPTSMAHPPTSPPPPPPPGGAKGRDVRAWIEGLWPATLRVARSLRWRNIALATVVVFVVSMGVVTVVEALAKKPLSAIVGGSTPAGATTSLGGFVGGGSSRPTPTSPSPSESTTTTPQTTAPNGTSTSTTSPSSTPSTTPGGSTPTTSPTPASPTKPGSTGSTPGSPGSSTGGTSSGSSLGGSSGTGSGTSASGTSASGASSTGTPSAGG